MHWLGIQTNFESLWVLVVIANVSTLLPLPFLSYYQLSQPHCNPCQQSTLMPLPQSRSTNILPDLVSELYRSLAATRVRAS